MPEMFDEHPGHLVLKHCRLFAFVWFVFVFTSTCQHATLHGIEQIGNAFHYFVGDGFAGTAFDGDGFAEADADGDGAAMGGVTAVP